MAALTQSAIDALLGVLATAIQDEARLIGGVHSDMKFIKDEMDSMNGFLMHLNKMESERHDDQVRAWMKQVREVSYVAEDCVDRYVRVVDRYGVVWAGSCGCVGTVAFSVAHPRAYLQLSKLGKQIAELKVRVRDVGERRQRYGVSVPEAVAGTIIDLSKMAEQNSKMVEKREAFVHALEEKDIVGTPAWFRERAEERAPLLEEDALVEQFPAGLVTGPTPEAATTPLTMIHAILEKCCPPRPPGGAASDDDAVKDGATKTKVDVDPDEAAAFRCTRKMFLCAMYVYPYPTNTELEKLKNKVVGVGVVANRDDHETKKVADGGVGAKEARKQVITFCYSILTTQQKSCLQYLTAFLHELEISRTSMVRRWVAEGLVGKDSSSNLTPEEAGERCFRELLLRGFVRAARRSDGGTVKSCVMDGPVRDFIVGITMSENFVAELPPHLERQRKIRDIVQRRPGSSMPPPPSMLAVRRRCNLRCCCTCAPSSSSEDASTMDDKDPMDKLVDFIRALPELYRLNVLDLGGCTGVRSRHLKSFAEVECLKYLSLRKTDISRLHAKHINKLLLLETLDIRETNISPRDTRSIYLPRLKHLLAGGFVPTTTKKASLFTVDMPDKIGSMREMETLSHVQVSVDGADLQGVAKLHQLRKLGVVVHANASTAALLGRVLFVLAANLRSLSIWVAVANAIPDTTTTNANTSTAGGGVLDISSMYEMASSMALENLNIKGKMSMPSWIGRATKLANVTLRDTEMDGGDALRRLATVQSLRCLKLSRKAFTEQALRFAKDIQFQALRFLVVEGDAVTRIVFRGGDTAPKLEKIVWVIGGGGDSKIAQMYNEDLIVGINYLPCLNEIELRASFKLTILSEWTTRQATLLEKQQATNSSGKQQDTSEKPQVTTSEKQQDATSEKPQATSSEKQQAAASEKTRYYHIRYISSSDGQLITELPRIRDMHTSLSLPAGVIN